MANRTRPFAAFEWMIAWRYLRARRAEGGVSVMTWISLVGITLAVFALIATLAVRSGFRAEFVDTDSRRQSACHDLWCGASRCWRTADARHRGLPGDGGAGGGDPRA